MRGRSIFRAALWLIATALVLPTNPTAAAEQGSLGATSAGSISISVSIAPRATISGVKDIVFAADPAAGTRASEDICLASNTAAGSYTISASGSAPGGAFQLSNGERVLDYSVAWAPRQDQSASDTTSTQVPAAAAPSDCPSGSASARLVVATDPAQLTSGAPYTGSLVLTVSPQ